MGFCMFFVFHGSFQIYVASLERMKKLSFEDNLMVLYLALWVHLSRFQSVSVSDQP